MENFVYLVKYVEAYEVNDVVGVFSDYVKAKEFEIEKGKDLVGGWLEIWKVELNKVYDGFGDVGEEV